MKIQLLYGLVLAIGLASCGGGGGSGKTSTPSGFVSSFTSSLATSSELILNSSAAFSSNSTNSSASVSSSSSTFILSSSKVSLNDSSMGSSVTSSISSASPLARTCKNLEAQSLTEGVSIDISTTFSGYGLLDLKLSSPADAEIMLVCLKDLREHATEDDSIQSVKIISKGNNEFQIQLSRYQLPVEYELSVYWGNPVVATRMTLAADEKSRVAFISIGKGTGDLASWTEDPNDMPLDAADAVCQQEAENAGLSGNFRAYLSIENQTDAICRLQGGGGLMDDGCGLSQLIAEEQLSTPFINLKGLPIAYGTEDILQGLWRLPLTYQADAKASRFGVAAWTGSTIKGAFNGFSCGGWSTADSESYGRATAFPGSSSINESYTLPCDEEGALLCFSAGAGHSLSSRHERTGKLAYLLELPLGTYIDIEVADTACREASGKDNVIAWYSDEQDDALCRLAGVSGKVTDNCGGHGLGSVVGPWIRADGYLLAETVSDLGKGVMAPLHLDRSGNYSAPGNQVELVRTDTLTEGTHGNAMTPCVNGTRMSAGSGWTYFSGSCLTIGNYRPFVYCFEQ